MRRIPRKARGRRNQFFEAEGVDELLSCMLRLMSEVSALRERQFVTERVLESRGGRAAAFHLERARPVPGAHRRLAGAGGRAGTVWRRSQPRSLSSA
jgi:hypothetical protein